MTKVPDTTVSDSASMSTCYLLQIPPELRLHIYRFVLILNVPLHLDYLPSPPTPKDDAGTNGEGDSMLVDSNENDWVDESDSDSESNDEISLSHLNAFRNEDGNFEFNGMDFHELEVAYYAGELSSGAERIFEAMERQQMIEDGISEDSESDDERFWSRSGRDLAVLRTSRQIYNEASALFYAEAKVFIEIDDLLDLAKERPGHILGRWQFAWMDTWRYHPIFNRGMQLSDGHYGYRPNPTPVETKSSRDHRRHTWTDRRIGGGHAAGLPKHPKGKLFPHIFARFQDITFVAIFEDDYVQNDTMWIDDETFLIRPSDAENFVKHVKTLKVIKDLVRLLSHSHKLNLYIDLEVNIEVESEFLNGLEEDSDFESDSDSEDETKRVEKLKKIEKESKILDMANQRATELLVNSALLSPLKKLTNVRKFSIKFDDTQDEVGDQVSGITLGSKYKNYFAKMKQIIEGNFQEREA